MSIKRYEVNGPSSVFEDENGSLVDYKDFAALEQHLIESERYGRQTDITIDNLELKLAQMAAENAGLRAALRPSDIPCEWTDAFGDTAVIEHDATGDNQGHSVSWSWVGNQEEVIKSVLLAVDNGIETPATDAFLDEVRAGAVDEVCLKISNAIVNCYQDEQVGLDAAATICGDFAEQIRKGVQS
jgi:hypothetical protein